MFDIWSFLLQTLTVSGVAALILVIKALFKDKLSPKWQFAVWSVLGIIMLLPAGMFGRYTLFRWQLIVELVKSWFGVYSFTKVLFPIPIIRSVPQTIAEWIFVVYVLGILVFIVKYLVSYFKLRRVLKLGDVPNDEKLAQIFEIASEQGIKVGKVIEVSGLPSAFVCGVFRPILVIPAENELNEKIVLHELFHLKNKDTLWSVIICALRCLHWCNPLIVYCANRAINDMESRCDQYVLEHLEGEERREYGHILLSMANDRFSKTPGSTCINNGGKNIRARIENTEIENGTTYLINCGTSFSTPIVAGTIALLMDEYPSLKTYPEVVISMLTASASDMSSTYNTYDTSGLEEKVGAGKLDYTSAQQIFGNRVTFTNSSSDIGYKTTKSVYLTAGQTIRISLAWLVDSNDETDTDIVTNYNLHLTNSSGTIVERAESSGNNIEFIEYTVTSTGTYTIGVYQAGAKKGSRTDYGAVTYKIS